MCISAHTQNNAFIHCKKCITQHVGEFRIVCFGGLETGSAVPPMPILYELQITLFWQTVNFPFCRQIAQGSGWPRGHTIILEIFRANLYLCCNFGIWGFRQGEKETTVNIRNDLDQDFFVCSPGRSWTKLPSSYAYQVSAPSPDLLI